MAEMNAHLTERWGKAPARQAQRAADGDPPERVRITKANPILKRYWDFLTKPASVSPWLSMPEMPAVSEIFEPTAGTQRGRNGGNGEGEAATGRPARSEMLELPANNIDGPWTSKEDYLTSHYALLREDVIAPLRDAVSEVQANPVMNEAGSICIYENVHITGFILSRQGPAARVRFSTARAKKRIRWEQSTRLRTGSIVALTPSTDLFRQRCVVAVVAARPLEGLQQNPPTVDLLFATSKDIEIDSLENWILVESRDGFFEANRHTLLSLQKMMTESFPMANHLIELEKGVESPSYVRSNPFVNLKVVAADESDDPTFENVNLLREFPKGLETSLDDSQIAALKRMLSKRVAIVQGPPGTGKTHVSVLAVKALLQKLGGNEPPLIITSQTNHALDQILRLIAEFEPNFIRLGSRSLDQDVIKPRTLREVRKNRRDQNTMPRISGSVRSTGHRRLNQMEKELKAILEPLRASDPPDTAAVLYQKKLITEAQYDSLESDAQDWVQPVTKDDDSFGSIAMWLGTQLVPAQSAFEGDNFDYEYEEVDLEFEQLKELEAEVSGAINDDEGFDKLSGTWLPIRAQFTVRSPSGYTEKMVRQALQYQNLYQIPAELRGAVYTRLRKELKQKIVVDFRVKAAEYINVAREVRLGDWEEDSALLKESRIIGMTTTGLSKYRPLIASLKPKVVMVEEASETLEGHVTAACFESLEQLILVGDHKQLRGHCSTHELEGPPFNLDVSLFERLIRNGVESTCLVKQRRMIPEIRRLLSPIYDQLEDHESVHNRDPVPGMGGVNSLFFSHDQPESMDSFSSKCNRAEADMIVGLFNYLIYNGLKTKDITVLTFYNGQRKLLLKELKALPNVQGCFVNVKTVDSYQGEENAVIILSLVRSSNDKGIGFLSAENRICVAISRARRGFYMFGDSLTMFRESPLWRRILSGYHDRIKVGFPVTCSNHGNTTWIQGPSDWIGINGGCQEQCTGSMGCGHPCKLKCHPFEHAELRCEHPCQRNLSCGHTCLLACHPGGCRCKCSQSPARAAGQTRPELKPASTSPAKRTTTGVTRSPEKAAKWHEFAQNEATGVKPTSPPKKAKGDSFGSGVNSEGSAGSSGLLTPPSRESPTRHVVPVKSSAMQVGEGQWRFKHKELFTLSKPQFPPQKTQAEQPFVIEESLLD